MQRPDLAIAIDRLGTARAVGRALVPAVAASTIRGWSYKGTVPPAWADQVSALARGEPPAPAQAAPAPEAPPAPAKARRSPLVAVPPDVTDAARPRTDLIGGEVRHRGWLDARRRWTSTAFPSRGEIEAVEGLAILCVAGGARSEVRHEVERASGEATSWSSGSLRFYIARGDVEPRELAHGVAWVERVESPMADPSVHGVRIGAPPDVAVLERAVARALAMIALQEEK